MRIVFYILWALLLAVFQPTLARDIAVWGIAPNLFLCFVVAVGLFRGRMEGAVCGTVFGLIYDLLIGRIMGIHALIYLYLGLGAGILGAQFFSGGRKLVVCLATAVSTLLAALMYYLVQKAIGADVGFVIAIFRIGLLEALYNGLVGFLLAYPVCWSMKLMRMKILV